MTAPPPAAVGSTPASCLRPARIKRRSASRAVCMVTDGASPGRLTGAFFTTAPRRVLTAHRGASARNLSGGIQKRNHGQDSTPLTSHLQRLLTTSQKQHPKVTTRSPATSL